MLAKYPEIARIARENIYTDIAAATCLPSSELIERIQQSSIVSVGIDLSHGINPGTPDYEQIRELVKKAITPPTKSSRATRSTPTSTLDRHADTRPERRRA